MPTPSFPTKTLLMHVCLGAALVMSGCSSTAKIAQNAKCSVYLEEVTDWSFEASHPAVIDQLTIMKVIKGVYGDGSSKMSAGGSKPMRVFSDEDAEFLAPLLAQGLSKAKPEQLVGFRVSSSAGSGSEPTAGSIYVRQGSIHLTISKGAGSTTFTPESAARTEYAPPYAAGGMGGVTAHVIDLQALSKAPMPAAMSVVKTSTKAAPTASASLVDENQFRQQEIDQLSKAKETIAKKDTEISVLRKESEWMKRELRDRDEELKALKASVKQVPKKKRAEAHATR